jgi:hypothetical protein
MRKRRVMAAKKAKVLEVGLFFVVGGKPFVDALPWMEVPSVAGFRTYGVGHPEFWPRLQIVGAVPRDLQYDEAPRGCLNYEDASGRFTLFADGCIIRNKRLVSKIMNEMNLPSNTMVLPDDHYRCPKCLRKKPTRKQEEEDWDF